jgi:hypothetical protein
MSSMPDCLFERELELMRETIRETCRNDFLAELVHRYDQKVYDLSTAYEYIKRLDDPDRNMRGVTHVITY